MSCCRLPRAALQSVVLAAALALTPLAARADSTAPAPPPPPRRSEIAIPTFQIISGVAIQLAGLTGFVLLTDQLEGGRGVGLGLAAFALAPALEGLAICGIGRLSRHYTGGCGAPVLAAYIGMAAAVGIYFAAHELLGGNDSLGGAAFIGGPAVLATYVWHRRKVPRADVTRSAFAPRTARDRSSAAAATVVPLWVARF